MAKIIFRLVDNGVDVYKSAQIDIPALDAKPKGYPLDVTISEVGIGNQYVGVYRVRDTVPVNPPPITCPPGQHLENGVCVPDVVTPPPTGEVLYDSQRDTTLHDGQPGTFTTVGNISAGGKGLECRASGNPRIVKNSDGTFSLLCDSGHGRFYGYTKNYNATMIIECAFWNKVAGQDASLRLRSRHNEADPCDNRFGGYGFTPDYSGWGSKREPCHNNHDQSVDGSLPSNPQPQQYFTVEYTVKDEDTGVRQIAKYNGTTVMNRVTGRQPLAASKFDEQSYFWVRQNIDSGTGELRIKRLRIIKA